MVLASWPNYHDPANFEAFQAATGAAVDMSVFGSNEEMLAKLQAGGSGWDVFVPTNYTITTYVEQDLIEPLDLSKLPNYDQASFDARFADAPEVPRPDRWGGFRIVPSRVEFWQGRADRLHDRLDYRLLNGGWCRSRLAP